MHFDPLDRWISQRTFASVVPAIRDSGRLEIGPASFGQDAEVMRLGDYLTIRHEGWRLERYVRYRPLVYFAVFGSPAAFECLRLAVASLFEFGRYDGDALLLTDHAHLDLAAELSTAYGAKIQAQAVEAADMLDWTCARYRVVDLPAFANYRPYLYLDFDVVCNGPIEPLLKQLAFATTLHAPGENAMTSVDNSYGATLLTADGLNLPSSVRGFSTGLLGFPDLATVAPLFGLVPQLATAYAERIGRRDAFGCYDQPFANYVALKTTDVGLTILDRYLDNRWFWYERLPERRGLTHFTGGTDKAGPKAQTMAAYIRSLRDTTS